MLEENERIVGVQSKVCSDRPAVHLDLVFLIAKLTIWIQNLKVLIIKNHIQVSPCSSIY